jgi:hypothetical protein
MLVGMFLDNSSRLTEAKGENSRAAIDCNVLNNSALYLRLHIMIVKTKSPQEYGWQPHVHHFASLRHGVQNCMELRAGLCEEPCFMKPCKFMPRTVVFHNYL